MELNSIYLLLDTIFFTQGLILGVIFIFANRKEKPTLFLGLFLICLVFRALPSVLNILYDGEIIDYDLIPDFFLFLTLPLFYIYAHKVSVIKEQKLDYLILIPGIIEFIVLMGLFFLSIPYVDYLAFDIYNLTGMVFSIFIAVKIIRFANKHLVIVKNQYASISGLQLYWVKKFAIVLLINLAITIVSVIFEYEWIELFLSVFDLVLVYWIIFRGIRQENIEPLIDQEDEGYILQQLGNNKLNPKEINLDDTEDLKAIVNTLDNHLEKSMVYKQKELSITDVSRSINTSPKKVSKAINQIKKINFNSYINTYRVNKAVEYLQDSDYNCLTIEGIANEVGFKSKSAFYSAFKKEKNCSPLDLRNQFTESNRSDS